jgi:predicted lipoprotein with Yx(FWY)xxD motif
VYVTAQTKVAEAQPPATIVGDRDRPPARPELLIDQRPTHSARRRSARNLRRGSAAAAGLATLTLVLAACGGGSSTYGAGGYGAAPATPSGAGTAATVDLHDSKLGQIIVDSQGRTLYLFEADKGGKSNCDGPCATAWPPLLTNGAPQADMGASGTLVGTAVRGDGTTQVTYGGNPLYYFVGDKASGDVTGQDIDQFGAKWYVVGKDGKKIDTD